MIDLDNTLEMYMENLKLNWVKTKISLECLSFFNDEETEQRYNGCRRRLEDVHQTRLKKNDKQNGEMSSSFT